MKSLKKSVSIALIFSMLLCCICNSFYVSALGSSEPDEPSLGTVYSPEMTLNPTTGYINVDYTAERISDGDKLSKRGATLPESYDSRELNRITPVLNQGSSSSCWAYSAITVSESSLIADKGYTLDNIDLSELHMINYSYSHAYDQFGMLDGDYSETAYGPYRTGGMHYMTSMALARWTGVVDEKKNPEFAYSNMYSESNLFENSKAYSVNEALMTEARWISMKDAPHIKKNIMDYGAGVLAYYSSSSYINNATGAYYYNGTAVANHEVTVVGWDDNYPVENFRSRCRPTEKGAWLVKNSYGTEYGNDGYIWISYEDKCLVREDACFFIYSNLDDYKYNYQYDGTTAFTDYAENASSSGIYGGASMSNVYTARGDQQLKAVSFFTRQANVSYKIEVYTGLSENAQSPTEGNLVHTETGKTTYCGYRTINLSKAVNIANGEKFSVVISLTKGENAKVSFLCDITDDMNWIKFYNKANAGESYFSRDGKTWVDVSEKQGVNFRIKALAVDMPEDTTDSDTDSENKIYFKYYGNGGLTADGESVITDGPFKPYTDAEDGDTITAINNSFVREGYSFVTWNTKSDGTGTNVSEGKKVISKSNVSLYAIWEKVESDSEENTEPDTTTDTSSDTETDTDTIVDTETDTTTDTSSDTETDTDTIVDTETDTTTDTATDTEDTSTDEPISYTLSYNLNGALGEIASQQSDENGRVTITGITPIYPGYIFMGWGEKTDDVSPTYNPGDELELNGDVTLYAIWKTDDMSTDTDTSDDVIIIDGPEDSDDSDDILIMDDSDTSTDPKPDNTDSDDKDTELLLGDVNGDNKINMEDVTALQKIIALLTTHENYGPKSLRQSDVNHDSEVNMMDVVTIQKYLAQLIDSFK
ncbi:MAG: lectin like domain-containing protein [Clostridia bacterium]|nr:lectin like domain-containing protein [Clostridia bacterium]